MTTKKEVLKTAYMFAVTAIAIFAIQGLQINKQVIKENHLEDLFYNP